MTKVSKNTIIIATVAVVAAGVGYIVYKNSKKKAKKSSKKKTSTKKVVESKKEEDDFNEIPELKFDVEALDKELDELDGGVQDEEDNDDDVDIDLSNTTSKENLAEINNYLSHKNTLLLKYCNNLVFQSTELSLKLKEIKDKLNGSDDEDADEIIDEINDIETSNINTKFYPDVLLETVSELQAIINDENFGDYIEYEKESPEYLDVKKIANGIVGAANIAYVSYTLHYPEGMICGIKLVTDNMVELKEVEGFNDEAYELIYNRVESIITMIRDHFNMINVEIEYDVETDDGAVTEYIHDSIDLDDNGLEKTSTNALVESLADMMASENEEDDDDDDEEDDEE